MPDSDDGTSETGPIEGISPFPRDGLGSIGKTMANWWFRDDWKGWTPRLFEWYFTRTRVGVDVRQDEEEGVLAALDRSLESSHRAADIGSGTGHYTLLLARRCSTVIAIDPSPPMRRYLHQRLQREKVTNVSVGHGRLPERLPVDTEVDVVVCVGILQYVQGLETALSSLAGIVRPGGRVIFTTTPATREARRYALQERLTRRQLWLRRDDEILDASRRAGLAVKSLTTHAGVTRLADSVRSR